MPSVRSRIKQFEALSGEDDKNSEEPNKGANKRECLTIILLCSFTLSYIV